MSTKFFFADERCMSEDEIADANRFDESALVCEKSAGPNGAVFSLEISEIFFYNLPRDIQLVNDNNNMKIDTVGDLIDATRKATKIITRYEAEQNSKKEFAELRKEKKWSDILPEQLPPSRSRVVEYVRRMSLS